MSESETDIRYSHGGDRYVFMELSETYDIKNNFIVQSLTESIRENPPEGMIEVMPARCSMMVEFDPLQTHFDTIVEEIKSIVRVTPDLGALESRYIEVPVLYDDPWSLEAYKEHKSGRATWERGLEYYARENDFDSIESAIEYLANAHQWVEAVGFIPGEPIAYNLRSPNIEETPAVPVYDSPRRWTWEGATTVAGSIIAIYAKRSPGGGYLFGHTPVPLFASNWEQENLSYFQNRDSAALLEPTDRVKFIPITMEQFMDIREEVENGTYEYNVETQTFDPSAYLESPQEYLDSLEESTSNDFSTYKYVNQLQGFVEEELKKLYRPNPVYEWRKREKEVQE